MNQLDKNPNIAKTDFLVLRALRIMHAEFIFWGRAPEIDINRIACRPLSLSLSLSVALCIRKSVHPNPLFVTLELILTSINDVHMMMIPFPL